MIDRSTLEIVYKMLALAKLSKSQLKATPPPDIARTNFPGINTLQRYIYIVLIHKMNTGLISIIKGDA